jgi:hypothetical protein
MQKGDLLAHILPGVGKVRKSRTEVARQGAPLSISASRAAIRKARRDEAQRIAKRHPLLTPRARLVQQKKTAITLLDEMVTDLQGAALERWALFEQVLEGRAKSVNFEASGGGRNLHSPISDRIIRDIGGHVLVRRQMARSRELAILDAFTAMQNGHERALSVAHYGLRLFPGKRNSRDAFLRGVVTAAERLVTAGY